MNRIYPASLLKPCADNYAYFNIDVGFQTWKIVKINLSDINRYRLNKVSKRDELLIEVSMKKVFDFTSHLTKYIYDAEVLSINDEPVRRLDPMEEIALEEGWLTPTERIKYGQQSKQVRD